MKFIHGYPISTCTSPRSTAAEKEQQEIHGFFFQEVDMNSSGTLVTDRLTVYLKCLLAYLDSLVPPDVVDVYLHIYFCWLFSKMIKKEFKSLVRS